MEYALEERIGNPELFTGRKEELTYFLKWIHDIKEKKSQSSVLLARRKMGKSALMERLFNITYYKNDGVIPFYYEIKENKMWVVDFCQDFFLTFIYQYIAYKTRKIEYLGPLEEINFKKVMNVATKEGVGYLNTLIGSVEYAVEHEDVDMLWQLTREAPKAVAFRQNEFIIQMIDEFQFLNAMLYRDKDMKIQANDLAGGYLSTAESKIAPLLVSGSWVGWLMNDLNIMLPARFKYEYLENMPEEEAVEMIYKYSRFFNVPVTEETVYLIARMSEGSPFYISAIIRSRYRNKDLTSIDGLTKTLEFETLDNRGVIKLTWMEYLSSALPRINDRNGKNIVLYLCQHRDREVTRKELMNELKLKISDARLEEKLKALVKSDIIAQGTSNYRYQGVRDNIFDKVFRGVYEEEIREFDVSTISKEYHSDFEKLKEDYYRLLGRYNSQKGHFAEYVILDRLRIHGREHNEFLKAITRYLPKDFNFSDYSSVWKYDTSAEYSKDINVDIFARSLLPGDYSIIGEVKSRDLRKFSKDEVIQFEKKFAEIKKLQGLEKVIGFIFSRSGFTQEAEVHCREKGIACSEDNRWLG
ncbi:MAG: hypothetical protein MUF15_17260 [Acidobacteria bacterium]|jgi:hypothetical protein|nr:hypothetical protein [Acidobacteriota bacterium]